VIKTQISRWVGNLLATESRHHFSKKKEPHEVTVPLPLTHAAFPICEETVKSLIFAGGFESCLLDRYAMYIATVVPQLNGLLTAGFGVFEAL
jgi:hypothetical protein